MTKLVYDEWGGLDGRTLTDEEYNNLTVEELLITIYQSSWALGVIDTDDDMWFTQEARKELEKKSAEQLKDFIRENGGLIISFLDKPGHRYVYPEYDIEVKDDCVLK
jgi:hypothetical protein